MNEDIKGFNTHRHEENPLEKQLHDTFHENFIQDKRGENLRRLVFKAKGFHTPPDEELSDREKKIILSTIQWLGSSVGMGFLDRCGFVRKKN